MTISTLLCKNSPLDYPLGTTAFNSALPTQQCSVVDTKSIRAYRTQLRGDSGEQPVSISMYEESRIPEGRKLKTLHPVQLEGRKEEREGRRKKRREGRKL